MKIDQLQSQSPPATRTRIHSCACWFDLALDNTQLILTMSVQREKRTNARVSCDVGMLTNSNKITLSERYQGSGGKSKLMHHLLRSAASRIRGNETNFLSTLFDESQWQKQSLC